MEIHRHNDFFEWLYNETTAEMIYRGKSFVRHFETTDPETATRLRLIYADPLVGQPLSDILVTIETIISVASIQRDAGLNCIEMYLSQPLSDTVRAEFESIASLQLVNLTSRQPRLDRRGLLVMDMDSTIIQIECIDELAKLAGVGAAVAAVTERAMQGELDFEQSLRARVAKLGGADASIIDNLRARLPLMPGLKEMIAELQSHQWRLVIASGGFSPFANYLKQLLSLDAAYSNELMLDAGKITGEVGGGVVDSRFKADVVKKSALKWQIPADQRLAIGDGANDIAMVESADFGIAFHAKPKLKQAADVAINDLDLRALPYLLLNLAG